VKIVDGRTQLEASNGDKVQLQVSCEQLSMQSPAGMIQAQGNVKIVAPDLKGTCENLSINWQEDGIVLTGRVHLDGTDVELNSDRLSIKWTGAKSVKLSSPGAEPGS
jgi:hypothetical protein